MDTFVHWAQIIIAVWFSLAVPVVLLLVLAARRGLDGPELTAPPEPPKLSVTVAGLVRMFDDIEEHLKAELR